MRHILQDINIDIIYLMIRINSIKEEIDFYVNQPPYSPQEKEKSLKKETLKYRSYRNDLNKQYHSFTKVMHVRRSTYEQDEKYGFRSCTNEWYRECDYAFNE